MEKTTLAVKLNPAVVNHVREFCARHGIKYSFFVEKALKDELEQEELKDDILDLRTLKSRENQAIPLEEYLKSRRV